MREIYWMCVCIVDSLCYRRLSIIGTSSYYSWRQREKKTKKILRISFDDEREREGERILSGCDPLA